MWQQQKIFLAFSFILWIFLCEKLYSFDGGRRDSGVVGSSFMPTCTDCSGHTKTLCEQAEGILKVALVDASNPRRRAESNELRIAASAINLVNENVGESGTASLAYFHDKATTAAHNFFDNGKLIGTDIYVNKATHCQLTEYFAKLKLDVMSNSGNKSSIKQIIARSYCPDGVYGNEHLDEAVILFDPPQDKRVTPVFPISRTQNQLNDFFRKGTIGFAAYHGDFRSENGLAVLSVNECALTGLGRPHSFRASSKDFMLSHLCNMAHGSSGAGLLVRTPSDPVQFSFNQKEDYDSSKLTKKNLVFGLGLSTSEWNVGKNKYNYAVLFDDITIDNIRKLGGANRSREFDLLIEKIKKVYPGFNPKASQRNEKTVDQSQMPEHCIPKGPIPPEPIKSQSC